MSLKQAHCGLWSQLILFIVDFLYHNADDDFLYIAPSCHPVYSVTLHEKLQGLQTVWKHWGTAGSNVLCTSQGFLKKLMGLFPQILPYVLLGCIELRKKEVVKHL